MTISTFIPQQTQPQTLAPQPTPAPQRSQPTAPQSAQTIGRDAFLARRAVFEQGATPRQLIDQQSVDQLESALDLKAGSSLKGKSSLRPSFLNQLESEGSESESNETPRPVVSKSVKPNIPQRYFEQESSQNESEHAG